MKRLSTVVLVLISIFGVFGIAFAHETVNSGTASMLVHIDPNDNPVVGKPAVIHIDIANTDKNFSISKCNCVLMVMQNGKMLLETKLSSASYPSLYNTNGTAFVFQAKGTYDITVTGSSKIAGLFTSFTLDKDIPIGVTANNITGHTHNSPFDILSDVLLFICVAITLYVFFISKRKNK